MRNIIIKSESLFHGNNIDGIISNICNTLRKMDYQYTKEANLVEFKKDSLFNKYSDGLDYRTEALKVIREGKVIIEKDNKGNVVFTWEISLIYLVVLTQALSFILGYFFSEILNCIFLIPYVIFSIINIVFGRLIIKMDTNNIVNSIIKH